MVFTYLIIDGFRQKKITPISTQLRIGLDRLKKITRGFKRFL